MRVHSAVGRDAGYVDESIIFMASLSAADRAALARAEYTLCLLLFGAKPDYPGDAAMHETLLKYGWKHDEPTR